MSFKYSFGFKRYHTQDYYLKTKYGKKIFKVPVDAGFTCPNRDGSRGVGGCSFCSDRGSGDFAGDRRAPILEQFNNVKSKLHEKWSVADYIIYFQPYTNTYGSLEEIKAYLNECKGIERVVGIRIATRADCIDEEIANLLLEFSKEIPIEVELGLQSIHEKTGEIINRCHSLEEFQSAFVMLKQRKIPVTVHLINGLPNESYDMMIETAKYVADLKPDGVKIHMLHIIKGTKLAKNFEESPYELLTSEEYVSLVCDQIELMPSETVIERVTGDAVLSDLVAPLWTVKKLVVINNIDKELIKRDSYQGKKYLNKKAVWEL